MSQAEETIILKLNDIIQLIAPDNPAINNNVYMVIYLDPHVMKLLLEGGESELVLNIEDGEMDNKDITEVILLDRNDVGYALEHDLVPEYMGEYFYRRRPTIYYHRRNNKS